MKIAVKPRKLAWNENSANKNERESVPSHPTITSEGGAFPCASGDELEGPSGDLFTGSSDSHHHADAPAFVAGLQRGSLRAERNHITEVSASRREYLLPQKLWGRGPRERGFTKLSKKMAGK